jgi:murein L,D-transpeptidase YcbB/YkuD
MNINVHERIKTLMVNMERRDGFRLLDKKNGTIDSGQYPFFTLTYFKEGKPVLVSESGGGKSMNKTAVLVK